MLCHISMNCEPLAEMPRMSLTCDVTIIKATADVKPELTGPDTKSIKNPNKETKRLLFLFLFLSFKVSLNYRAKSTYRVQTCPLLTLQFRLRRSTESRALSGSLSEILFDKSTKKLWQWVPWVCPCRIQKVRK